MGLKDFFIRYPKSIFRTFGLLLFVALLSVLMNNVLLNVTWLFWLSAIFFFVGAFLLAPLVLAVTLLQSTTGFAIGFVLDFIYLLFISCTIVALRKLKKERAEEYKPIQINPADITEEKVESVLADTIEETAHELPSPLVERKKPRKKKTASKAKKRKTSR